MYAMRKKFLLIFKLKIIVRDRQCLLLVCLGSPCWLESRPSIHEKLMDAFCKFKLSVEFYYRLIDAALIRIFSMLFFFQKINSDFTVIIIAVRL